MSPKEIRLALGVLDTRERLIFRMAVFDGMRPGEILAIRLGNICEQSVLIDQRAYKGDIDTPKGRKGKRTSRTVGLSPGTVAELQLWRSLFLKQEPGSYLFPTEQETPIWRDNIWNRYLFPKLNNHRLKAVGWVPTESRFAAEAA